MRADDALEPLLEIRGVTKRFGPVVACDDVALSVGAGEIRGLLGQNGAGKTTLISVVGGVVEPDAGTVRVGGHAVELGDPLRAADAGIGIVHQHLSLVGPLTVWENIALGERGALNGRRSAEQVESIGRRYGIELDPQAVVDDLTPGERQRVEIVKCLRREPRVVILDEPTSVMSMAESRRLFQVLRNLVTEHGLAVVLISHRLEEIMAATDAVTVMRDGRVISTAPTRETSADELARQMLGRDVSLAVEGAAVGAAVAVEPAAVTTVPDRAALELDAVTVTGDDGRRLLDGLSLAVGRGEIVGVAGIEGNGQHALVDVLSGLVEPESGSMRLEGSALRPGRHSELARVGVIPSDRHEAGCVLGMTVMENLALGRLGTVSRAGVISRRRMAAQAGALVEQYGIVGSVHAPMWSLSGGNQQRVVLARELAREPAVLVASQPTRGLDVGAMEDLWHRLRAAARAGTAVLLISTELDEILALAQRVAVIHRGRIVGEVARDELDTERLGLLMGGQAA